MDIGIIGGADGPTAVFINGPDRFGASIAIGVGAIAVILAVGIRIYRAKKKKH